MAGSLFKNITRRGDEYYGPHPINGSETGRNFWVNPIKNVWHCFRHNTGGSSLSLLAIKKGLLSCMEYRKQGLRGEAYMKTVDLALELGYITEAQVPRARRQREEFFEGPRFIPPILGRSLMDQYTYLTLEDTKEIYVFQNNIHRPIGETLIQTECASILGDEYRRNRTLEVIDYIRARTYVKREEPPLNLVPLENGVYNLETEQLEKYNPAHFWTLKIPVTYDPKAKTIEIYQFLKDVTEDTEDAKALAQFTGYCLYRAYPIHKAFILLGPGANGKSTFIALLEPFLGKENSSQHGIHSLCDERQRFITADLYHKLLNSHADIPDKKLFDTGRFKMLTGGDTVTAEKKFRDSFSFKNYTKFLFSANWLPETADQSYAFHRRIRVVNFPKIFKGQDYDPNILEKLTSADELSGLLNLALDALKTLLDEKELRGTKPVDKAREKYEQQSNPVAYFVDKHLELNNDSYIPKEDLYNRFIDFCERENTKIVTKTKFFKELPEHIRCTTGRARVEGARPWCVIGIEYVDDKDNQTWTQKPKIEVLFN